MLAFGFSSFPLRSGSGCKTSSFSSICLFPKPLLSLTMISPNVSSNADEISKKLADMVLRVSKESVDSRGQFTVAISGGSLPKILAKELSTASYSSKIAWDKWKVFFVDERYVPLDHSDSNYLAAKTLLFEKIPIPLSNTIPIDPSLSLQECCEDYARKLDSCPKDESGFPIFDLILLGLGEDGHTASLFPKHALLEETEKTIATISDSPKPPPERLTFTLPVINKGRYVAFVVAGAGKKVVIQDIFENPDCQLPGKLVNPESKMLEWFIDEAAAELVKKNC